jgi:hypothetical protein
MVYRVTALQVVKIVGNLLVLIECPGLIFDDNPFPSLSITLDVNQDIEPPPRALNAVCCQPITWRNARKKVSP